MSQNHPSGNEERLMSDRDLRAIQRLSDQLNMENRLKSVLQQISKNSGSLVLHHLFIILPLIFLDMMYIFTV